MRVAIPRLSRGMRTGRRNGNSTCAFDPTLENFRVVPRSQCRGSPGSSSDQVVPGHSDPSGPVSSADQLSVMLVRFRVLPSHGCGPRYSRERSGVSPRTRWGWVRMHANHCRSVARVPAESICLQASSCCTCSFVRS